MQIVVSNSNPAPIYEQIVEQVKKQIVTGKLVPGEKLPSLRMLAGDLGVSVITTKRAYAVLEEEGFVSMVAGKGCFVADMNADLIREENLKRIQSLLSQALELADESGIGIDEVSQMFEILKEDE
jgi:GntR family transcriptional regulator